MQNGTELEPLENVQQEETALTAEQESCQVPEEPAAVAQEPEAAEETPEETIAETELPAQQETPKPEQKPKRGKKTRRRPWPLKILLGLVAFVLCIAMFAVTIAGAVVVDLRVMTSQGGIKEILTQLIMPGKPTASVPLSLSMALTVASPLPDGNTEGTVDMSNFLLDAAFDILQQQFGGDIPMTKEQVGDFLEQSTAKDFLAEKLSGVVDDFINETSNTTITRDEVMNLVTENKQLIEETFEITIDDSVLEEMEQNLEEVEFFDQLEEKGLADVFVETVVGSGGEDAAGAVEGMTEAMATFRQAMSTIGQITADSTLFAAIGAFVVLFLLVFLVNFSLPKTLSDTGIVLTFAGLILSAPKFLYISGLLQTILPVEMSGVLPMVGGLLSAVEVVHFAILGAGVALIILAIVAKSLKNARLKKAMA